MSVREEITENHIWVEKDQNEKEKHIHTFDVVFPPLQEATSFAVRLQCFSVHVSRYSK